MVNKWIAPNSIEMGKANRVLIDSVKKDPPGGAAGGLNRPNLAFWRFGRLELRNLNGL